MKIKFLVYFFLLTYISYCQDIQFNIKYSEQLAVFVFLQNLSDYYPQNSFKTEFQKSKFNNEANNNSIKKFNSLSIDYNYSFHEYPYGFKSHLQSRDLIRKNLLETNNLQEFKSRSFGILPIETLNDISDIIKHFTPIYNEIIYLPNKEIFEKQIIDIKKYAKDHQIEDFFNEGLLFYNSSWDNSIPINIAFYPLPNSDSFTATAFNNNFISAIQTNLNSYVNLFSVMMHETYHLIFNEQSLTVKSQIDLHFKENKSKCSNYASLLLNEVLATALGNGYVYEKLTGKLDTNDWYYYKYINLMSKKTYQLITEYINEKKSMDKNFIDKYIKIYEENYPNWINELENIMAFRYIISENPDDFNSIRNTYWYRSLEENETELTENSIDKMKRNPMTKVIVVSKNNLEKLKLIKKKFKELNKWNFNAEKDFSYKILLEDKSQLIVLNQKKFNLKVLFETIK